MKDCPPPHRPSLGVFALRVFICATALGLGACSSSSTTQDVRLHTPTGSQKVDGAVVNVVRSQGARALQSAWDAFELVGAKNDATAKAGGLVTLTLYFKVLEDAPQAPMVFVHARQPAAKFNAAQADHRMLASSDAALWKNGDIVEDSVDIRVPKDFDVDTLELMVGLYEGKKRFEVESGPHEKDDRVLAGTVKIEGGAAALPTVVAPKVAASQTMTIDGKLDEEVWSRAQRVGPFIRHDGKKRVRFPTFARLAWDEKFLYVAFECADKDAHTPYKKRDDPLYNSEAVEIFIDADGDRDAYVELQAAPNELQFDAAFKGGARKNFDTSYDATYVVKNHVNGTVNDDSDVDDGWVSEWKIDISSLRDIPAPPTVGTEWKINLFRLERIRKNGKVVRNEATAWSSPLSGDFHNLRRFGTLQFGP